MVIFLLAEVLSLRLGHSRPSLGACQSQDRLRKEIFFISSGVSCGSYTYGLQAVTSTMQKEHYTNESFLSTHISQLVPLSQHRANLDCRGFQKLL